MSTFPTVSKAEWLAKVTKDLRGRPLSQLDFTVADHQFSPFHHPEDQPEPPPPVRGPRAEPCRAGVSLEIKDPKADNQVILDLLNKGADTLLLRSSTVDLSAELDTLLQDVYREIIHVYLLQDGPNANLQSLQHTLFNTTSTPYANAETTERIARMLVDCAAALARDKGVKAAFWLDVDDEYLTAVASMRALRLCYRLIADAYGVTTPCHLVVDPFTKHEDKYTGMIATSAQVTAALVGGADTVFIPSGATDDAGEKKFLRRVALNSLNVLNHEAYLNRVADPAAGSYYLETLTDRLARTAWARFQDLQA